MCGRERMPRKDQREKGKRKPKKKWGTIGAPNSRTRKLWLKKIRKGVKKHATKENVVKAAKVGAMFL